MTWFEIIQRSASILVILLVLFTYRCMFKQDQQAKQKNER